MKQPMPARRHPVQRRSAERLDSILSAAEQLLEERGADGLRMNDLAQRAGVSIGSLYQYFPERGGVIAALALRYNEAGVRCVEELLADVLDHPSLLDALKAVVEGYYEMFRSQPVMRDIWAGAMASRALQIIDREDCELHGKLIAVAAGRATGRPEAEFQAEGTLLAVLIASAVRHAMILEEDEARRGLTIFNDVVVTGFCMRIFASH